MVKEEKVPNRFYVYLHRRKDNNEVFYVGKGCGRRARTRHKRSEWWQNVVSKYGYYIEFVEKGLSEQCAYDLEVETIKFYKECGHTLCNMTKGGDGGLFRESNDERKTTKGIKLAEETKQKLRENYTGARAVSCSNGMIFISTRGAAMWVREFNPKAHATCIVACCKGKQKTAYGYIWKYF